MHLTWPGHAQLFAIAAEKTVLMDPWLAEPVFAGAWFRYPPPPWPDASFMPRPDFVLLSHAHEDHSGPKTLRQLHKDATVVMMKLQVPALHRRVTEAGFEHVLELEPWETRELSPGLKVTFVPNDRGWDVASMVVEADGVRLYHGNDNPLTIDGYQELVKRLGPIDLAFLPFAGASSYPTNFEGDQQLLDERCAQKKKEGLRRFTDGIQGLRPKEALPFASSWALLEEGELWKNYVDRPTHDEALKAAMPIAAETGTHLLRLEPGDEWSPELGAVSKGRCRDWPQTREAVARYAKQEKARVDAAIHAARTYQAPPSDALLDQAVRSFMPRLAQSMKPQLKDLSMNAGLQARGHEGWRLEYRPGEDVKISRGLVGDEAETLTMLPSELWSILMGLCSFEDVWYGYRLHVKKREGAGYYRGFWEMLLGCDTEALGRETNAALAR